jgi:hypothetical protein
MAVKLLGEEEQRHGSGYRVEREHGRKCCEEEASERGKVTKRHVRKPSKGRVKQRQSRTGKQEGKIVMMII